MNYPALKPAFCAANGIIITRCEGKSIYFGLLNINDTVLKERVKKAYPDCECVFIKLEPESFNIKLSQLFSEEQTPNAELSRDNRESIIDKIDVLKPIELTFTYKHEKTGNKTYKTYCFMILICKN